MKLALEQILIGRNRQHNRPIRYLRRFSQEQFKQWVRTGGPQWTGEQRGNRYNPGQ